jgi:hypothetical protein
MSRTDAGLAALAAVAALALAATASGCRQDMYDQPKATPLVTSDFFRDGRSARNPVAGTVARGQLAEDRGLATGSVRMGSSSAGSPMSVDRELLLRGRQRFDIFCSPCHDRTGSGEGMVVRRGYKRPTSYHEERLARAADRILLRRHDDGFGENAAVRQPDPRRDRWAIAAYVARSSWRIERPSRSSTAEDRTASRMPRRRSPGSRAAAPGTGGPWQEAVR